MIYTSAAFTTVFNDADNVTYFWSLLINPYNQFGLHDDGASGNLHQTAHCCMNHCLHAGRTYNHPIHRYRFVSLETLIKATKSPPTSGQPSVALLQTTLRLSTSKKPPVHVLSPNGIHFTTTYNQRSCWSCFHLLFPTKPSTTSSATVTSRCLPLIISRNIVCN